MCFVLRDKSILNLLQSASREFELPGNLFLATFKESIISFLSIFSFCIDPNSPSKKLKFCDYVVVNEKNLNILKKNLLVIIKKL